MPHYCIEYKPNEAIEVVDGKPDPDPPGPPLPMRIVEANNQARAVAHVVENTLTVRRATPQDFMSLANAGGEIEKAL